MDTRILPPDLFDMPAPVKKKGEAKKEKPASKPPLKKTAPREKAAGPVLAKAVSAEKRARAKGAVPEKADKKAEADKKIENKKQKGARNVAPKSMKVKPPAEKTKTIAPPIEKSAMKTKGVPPKAKRSGKIVKKPAAQNIETRAGEKREDANGEKAPVSDFPWESPDREGARAPCPSCGEPVYPDSTVCIHCGAQFMTCPHCNEHSAALHNPKMATEQRLNKIFRQYTLFSLALPALPLQPILDCSACAKRIIFCEKCRKPMKTVAEKCPACGFGVRRTKLIVNPFSIFESLLRRPNMGKALQQAVSDLLRSLSEW